MNKKRIIGGYIAVKGMEISKNEFLSEDCEIKIPDTFPIKDKDGNVIGMGSAKVDKKELR